VPQRGVAHEPRGARHHDFLACHFLELPAVLLAPD